jgi:sugar lactone lactonase YvrE
MLTTSSKGLVIRLIAVFLFSISSFAETPGNIQTVAGNGNSAFSGDGGPATQAGINVPVDVYLDSSGNMFITDQFNNRIRKVTPGGIISTVAGNGTAGFAGDGGPAVDAEINAPTGILGDSAGNLYISDAGNERIRKVNRSGIITTIAGNGSTGYSGDGGPAVDAGFYNPVRVAILPNGNILVADQSHHRVRLINSSTGIVTTFAATASERRRRARFQATAARLPARL